MKEGLDLKQENIHVLHERMKMKLYSLESPIESGGDVVDINDSKGRISSYFIWNEGNGSFLKFTTPQGVAQKNIKYSDISEVDFLSANIGVPIFSEKAMHEINNFIPEIIEWAKIVISCNGDDVIYNLCKVNNFLDLIDKENSLFRILSDGDRILSKAVYKKDLKDDFIIARDINFKERLVVSQSFVDFCHSRNIKISFDVQI
ncbi:hypothetical protein [Pectobacterium polaris]|uniref:Uncharacterized protein n=1 Tax=Pectobacterium polaris TaxID=2042057 RepID=A0AAW5GJ17_9GAMM|nr:hypothetical protein [Pectobacterium polaris]MCL6353306.1 hypothetical protein [Pectobacterium polaris]MCL6370708.1 hypothetical protein [Pectobacterium polaris]